MLQDKEDVLYIKKLRENTIKKLTMNCKLGHINMERGKGRDCFG